MLLESKVLLSNNFFHTNLILFNNSDCLKFLLFNDGGHKLGHFGIFDALFPFLAFFKL